MLSCLSGCGDQRRLNGDLSWVKPIHLEYDTIDWLTEHQAEWPATMEGDLNEILIHNDKCWRILGKR